MKKITLFLVTIILFSSCGVSKPTAQDIKNENPEWTNEQISLILSNKIEIGMTKKMVETSWGKPSYINKMSGTYVGDIEAWSYYKSFGTNVKTVTFTKGIVSQFSQGGRNY